MFVNRLVLGFCVGLIVVLAGTLLDDATRSDAEHPFGSSEKPRRRIREVHPFEGQTAEYTLCTSDPGTQQVWAYGAEIWEDHMVLAANFDNTPSECDPNAELLFQWEFAVICQDGARACLQPIYQPSNMPHESDNHWHIHKASVAFDTTLYGPLNADWRAKISAHEVGHGMSLKDHENGDCNQVKLIMMLITPSSGPACGLTPLPAETCTAWTEYGYDTSSDRNFIDLPATVAYDDLTRAQSDDDVDGCDPDADNDGLSNVQELVSPCPPFSDGPTFQIGSDTDGDRTLDGAECAHGTNPRDAASFPGSITPDSDNDKLHDGLEALLSTDPNDPDTDDDGVLDGIEFRYYGTYLLDGNLDNDVCHDAKEIASINADTTVSSIDLGQVAQHFGPGSGPNYIVNFDLNKDGTINSLDTLFIAANFGNCVVP